MDDTNKEAFYMECIFCKIANGTIPCNKVYEDDICIAFYDLSPQAPVHFLVIPKAHIQSVNELTPDNAHIVGHIFTTIGTIAKELSLDNGYRVVTNCGEDGGQTVAHLHFHVLAKRSLAWPPG